MLKKYTSTDLKNDHYYRLAYSYTHNEAEAQDIVQNGAYKAILNSDSLKNIDIPSIEMIKEDTNGLADSVNKEIYELCEQYSKEAVQRAEDYREAWLSPKQDIDKYLYMQ